MAQGTVLIVDDDQSIVDFLTMALETEGYAVLTAANGQAIGMARDQGPDVILLDIYMPGMDGIEVSRRLRADATTAHIPIIVMSAYTNLRKLGPQIQANDELAKPFRLTELYATVAKWTQQPPHTDQGLLA